MNSTNVIVNEGVTICSFINKNKCTYSFTLGLNLQGIYFDL